jgi:predicted AAA+ superfamily ATPase
MKYINRDIESLITDVSHSYSAIIVTGPRQVGKTTTLKRLMGERKYVTLDDIETRQIAQTDPEMFLSIHAPPLLIDEVQYAPQLFSRIKMAVDEGAAPGSFWMTGSHMYELMQLAGESLAGRVAILKMYSLSQSEIFSNTKSTPFSLDLDSLKERAANGTKTDTIGQYERIWKGSMPGHISGRYPNRDIFYSSYVTSYIERDIKDMAAIGNIMQFGDFIRAAACRVGQILNVHAMAQDVGISDDTAKRWIGYMEKSGILFFLRPYSNNLLKRTIKAPKLYFFDTGLVAHLTKYPTADILMNGALSGAILENYVVMEILKSYVNNGKEAYMYYYRDTDNKEIDIVLESGNQLYPLEIKKAASPSPAITRTFKVLDTANIPRGNSAIVCTKQELAAINKDTVIVPTWLV